MAESPHVHPMPGDRERTRRWPLQIVDKVLDIEGGQAIDPEPRIVDFVNSLRNDLSLRTNLEYVQISLNSWTDEGSHLTSLSFITAVQQFLVKFYEKLDRC